MLYLVASKHNVGNINPGQVSKLLLASQASIFQTKLLIFTQLSMTDWSLLLGRHQNQGQYPVLSEHLSSQAEKASLGQDVSKLANSHLRTTDGKTL